MDADPDEPPSNVNYLEDLVDKWVNKLDFNQIGN
jgi:hypothetical protein